jgi:8-oxo-dGTP pyrophosphatase MutT (NUDIX family)
VPILKDIVTKTNIPTGRTATIDMVRTQGLWERGVHALVYTPDKRIVMQKRSKDFDYQPSEIEISVGGGVDAGETPLQAAMREVSEELGVVLPARHFVPLGVKKFNHSYKSGGRRYYKRVFIYSFKVCVSQEVIDNLRPKDGEAVEIFVLSQKQVLAAIKHHWVRGHGKLMTLYAYWYFLVRSID